MVNFFDHLFYRIYWWNKKIVKENEIPVFSTLLGLSVFHVLNFTTIIFFYLVYIQKDPMAYPKSMHIGLMFIIFVIDYFIYINGGRYKRILEASKSENNSSWTGKDIYIIIYIIFTFSTLIWVIIKGRQLI